MGDFEEKDLNEARDEETEPTVTETAEDELTGHEIDGEYHFVRPEEKLYEDAGFVPESESTDIPEYYIPTEKKPKEKKEPKNRRGLKVAGMCLACLLIGGIAGGAASWMMSSADKSEVITTPPISQSESGEPIKSAELSSGSAAEVYALGCRQAVAITTEATVMNFWGMSSSTAVSGSGFVVTEDGYIVTNCHVVSDAYTHNYKVTVLFKDGSSYDAQIIGLEEDNDIAVLKIDANNLSAVSIGNSDNINVGDDVFAIGNPTGELEFSMTSGRVSALDRNITTEAGSAAINMFQIDAAVNGGNSGGPLYNANGEVIGVVTAKVSGTGIEGLGFAIPINDAVSIANDLITQGYVTGKAYLGANIDNRYTSVYAEYYNMPEGAYVYSVEKGSCAEKYGITSGDIITKIGDSDVASYNDLSSAIHKFKAGDSAEVTLYRQNEYITVSVVFDEAKPDTGSENSSDPMFGSSHMES